MIISEARGRSESNTDRGDGFGDSRFSPFCDEALPRSQKRLEGALNLEDLEPSESTRCRCQRDK